MSRICLTFLPLVNSRQVALLPYNLVNTGDAYLLGMDNQLLLLLLLEEEEEEEEEEVEEKSQPGSFAFRGKGCRIEVFLFWVVLLLLLLLLF